MPLGGASHGDSTNLTCGAARLPQEPNRIVIDAAFAVGYGDPSHFAHAFRRLAGMSLRVFRRDPAIQ